jgi:acyl phosphate:glycerol-3-phosphate acyltransferase
MLGIAEEALIGLIAGYVFGAFPTGYFVGRLHGVDVRKHGSGRTGGSNVLRTVGWFAFGVTILGDALKGAIPLLLVMNVLVPGSHTAAAGALVGALLGSNWSVVIAWLARGRNTRQTPSNLYESARDLFAKAKGGAGVVTTACAALTLYWQAVVPLIVVGLTVLLVVRYSSIASITVALLYPLLMSFFFLEGGVPGVYVIMSVVAAAIVLYVLTPNLRRLRAGTEQKFGQRLTAKHPHH